jgi:hypothetical protein
MFSRAILHELRRRDVMKLIGVGAQKPIAAMHLLSRDMKQYPRRRASEKSTGSFSHRQNAFFAQSEVLRIFQLSSTLPVSKV